MITGTCQTCRHGEPESHGVRCGAKVAVTIHGVHGHKIVRSSAVPDDVSTIGPSPLMELDDGCVHHEGRIREDVTP